VRLPQAIAGALTPLAVYLLGKETFGKGVGLLAAALIAFSALHINHAQELRLYALMTLLTTLSLYALVKAERTGKAVWWAAFAVSASLNVLNAYVVLILFVPVLALYLTWLLWRLWRARTDKENAFLWALLATCALAAVCLATYMDMATVPRPAPKLTQLSPLAPITSTVELLSWMSRFGIEGQGERVMQMLILLSAIAGAAVAVKHPDKRKYATLFLLSIIVPATLLALFSTTNVVFQRYALFAMPAYFLLVANGLLAAFVGQGWGDPRPLRKAAMVMGVLLTALILGLHLWSTLLYHSPDGHRHLAYRPDFRGVARYLAERTTERDLIVFLDDPGLGYTITGYYLSERFPAPAYDARDPRLYSRQVGGSIYWVISAENLSTLEGLTKQGNAFAEMAEFNRVVVLREDKPDNVMEATNRMVERLDALQFGYQPIRTMRGTLLQARGDVEGAASVYQSAGAYFPVGADYLRTATGYDAKGDAYKAWREAAISKFWEPGQPDVHLFYARKLREDGYEAESQIEARLAEALGQK
jgi:hypothetical protein